PWLSLLVSALRDQGRRDRRGGGRRARGARRPRIHRSSRARRADRRVPPAAVREGLHDVVRELSGGDGAASTPGDTGLEVTFRYQLSAISYQLSTLITLSLKESPSVPLEAEA